VVDDEPLVGASIRRLLTRGYEVTVAGGAHEALARLEAGESFDLILCDLMMPQMTGMELHAEIVRRWPALAERMVFLTGGAFTPRASDFLAQVPNERLEKPFAPEALRDLVERLLEPTPEARA
jgi:CheY-like chemotaxis protein